MKAITESERREKTRLRMKQWRIDNADRLAIYNREYRRSYKSKNRQKINEYQKRNRRQRRIRLGLPVRGTPNLHYFADKHELKTYSTVYRERFMGYRYRAKKRQFAFDFEVDDFISLISSPCHYCGHVPNEERLNGIDRKDNSQGYTISNSLPCCSECNYLKLDRSYGDFVARCITIATRLSNI